MDVAFALDSSDDVNAFQWQQQKDFVKHVIDGLKIAPDGVHTGIVSYAAMPSIDLKLNVRSKDKQQLFETVQGLGRAVGRRNIGGLLDMSKYEVCGHLPSIPLFYTFSVSSLSHSSSLLSPLLPFLPPSLPSFFPSFLPSNKFLKPFCSVIRK